MSMQGSGAGGTAGWWTSGGPAPEWWRPDPPREQSPPEQGDLRSPDVADSRAAFWGLMAFTFVLLISPQTIVPALKPLRLAFVAAVGTVVALLAHRFSHGRPLAIVRREMVIAAALGAWAVVTIPWSYWPGGSVSFLVGMYFKSLAVFWLLANTLNTPSRIRRVAWALILMSVPLALSGVRHFASGVFFPGGARSERIVGYTAPLTENPNDLALMLNLLLPLAVALLLLTERHVLRVALLAVIVLDVAGVIATFSRGGFLTLGVVFLAYLWKFRGRPEQRWTWGLVVCLVVVMLAGLPLLPASYVERLATITDVKADPTGSAEARWSDAGAALRFVSEHPIVGAGPDQNILALNQERGKRWTEIHNVYLEYAVDLGLPGLLLFLVLLTLCVRSTTLVQRESAGRPGGRELFCLAEGVQVSLLAFGVGGMFHPVAYHFYFYYMAGLAIALHETWRALAGAGDRSPAVAG
jgi:probable O-glycosylation ligase (exosortase A-associated)